MSCPILQNVKVADFSWVGVGPIATKYLADHGATVVRIESATRPDFLRLAPPFRDNEVALNRSGFYANFNSSKYGVSLDLNHPDARDVARRLIAWADVVAESFTPGSMARWGLDYEQVRRWKPDVVYFSTSQMGQTGPWKSQPGFGMQLAALSGFYHLTSWPDRAPAGPYGAYTDFISSRLGGAAILAALSHRTRTGRGARIDLSQLESGIQFLGPLLMDALNNAHDAAPTGNTDAQAVPHNAYPCRSRPSESGTPIEGWCVIAVSTDGQWRALRRVMGEPPWARRTELQTFLGRKEHEAELDGLIGEWTKGFGAHALMKTLQAAGVPAGVVQSCEDLHADPQLAHRGHFVTLAHPEIGPLRCDGLPSRLSDTPGTLHRAAPCLGQDNEFVYVQLLGMPREEYDRLKQSGAFA